MMTTTLRARRRRETAQSLTVAIIVLFLLLFLGGLFIALIVNNMRAGQTAAKGYAADKLAQAGLQYIDDQLTKSPEGADWRPVPFVADAGDNDGGTPLNYNDQDTDGDGLKNAEPLRVEDPDYDWLRPCREANGTQNPEPCGYSRIDFGGRTPSAGNLGGRALVKLLYRPYKKDPVSGNLFDDVNENGVLDAGEWTDANNSGSFDAADVDQGAGASHGLRLFSVGRAGIVDPSDPTTFGNSEGKGQRRELIAFKSLDLVKFVRLITDKDNRSQTVTLGTTNKVLDRPFGVSAIPNPPAPVSHSIESTFVGAMHSNTALTFAGINHLLLNTQRGESLTVAGALKMQGVNDQTATPNATDASQVDITRTDLGSGLTPIVPSGSSNFATLNGVLRDNAPQVNDPLRRVARVGVPLIDQNIGDNGLTRYRALTRDSQPLDARFVGPTNPLGSGGGPFVWSPENNPEYPGTIGWGAGLYLDNREDLQTPSDSLIGGYSPRANWLGTDTHWWNGDNRYVPPAVVVTLTPRYMIIQRSSTSTNRSFLRDNQGRRINQTTVIRYSGLGNGGGDTSPSVGLPDTVRKLEGYPAQATETANVWEGEYVVYAEGNIRIRGTAGGLDPETLRYYIRHLTVVSGGNIYIDGNLLKDNIAGDDVGAAAQRVRGRSSIALLAKDYVVLNTTQFLSPGDNLAGPEASGADARAIFVRPDSPSFALKLNQGPLEKFQPSGMRFPETNPDSRIAPSSDPNLIPQIMVRHSAAGVDGATAVRLGVNNDFFRFPQAVAWPNASPQYTTLAMGGPTSVEPGIYFDSVFTLKDGGANPALLYPDTTAPFTAAPAFGIDNLLSLSLDVSAGVPNQTDYRLSRYGVVPLDIRVEALIYAQEGSFFVIPGPWFNPDPNDSYEAYIARGSRAGDNLTVTGAGRIDPRFPLYGQPQDVRITVFGAIAENLPAETSDQGAWLEKWGWIPNYYGSTGLPSANGYAPQGSAQDTVHGANGLFPGPLPGAGTNRAGNGILYLYDEKLVSPYANQVTPLRRDGFGNILPAAPRLPVAPGLLYVGEAPGA